MTSYMNQTAGHNDEAFSFERSGNGFTMSADIDRLCQMIGEQVQKAVAEIDFEAIGEEVRRTMTHVGEDIRQAVDGVVNSPQRRAGPARVRVEVEADRPPAAMRRRERVSDDVVQQHKIVLTMLAEGKITTEEAARLLDLLGG